jgi:hypothetical protein
MMKMKQQELTSFKGKVADFGSRRVRTFPDEERIIILRNRKTHPPTPRAVFIKTGGEAHQNDGL